MARKRHKRRKHRARSSGSAVARQNPHRRHRRRSNPPGVMSLVKSLPAFAGRAAISGVTVVTGVIAARKVRGLVKQEPGSLLGSAIELATGIIGGALLAAFVNPRIGEAFAAGGVAAPVMTFVQNLKIPHISDSLGDDGYVIGDGTGLTLVSAHPDDYGPVAVGDAGGGYVRGGDASVQGYTPGARRAAVQMDVARVA